MPRGQPANSVGSWRSRRANTAIMLMGRYDCRETDERIEFRHYIRVVRVTTTDFTKPVRAYLWNNKRPGDLIRRFEPSRSDLASITIGNRSAPSVRVPKLPFRLTDKKPNRLNYFFSTIPTNLPATFHKLCGHSLSPACCKRLSENGKRGRTKGYRAYLRKERRFGSEKGLGS